MSTATVRDQRRDAVGAWLAWRPGWPLAAFAAAAWVVVVWSSDPLLAVRGAGAELPALGAPTAGASDGPWVWSCSLVGGGVDGDGRAGPGAALLGWVVMCVAMMSPTLLAAAQHVGLSSVRRRRHRAVVLFAAAGLGVWAVVGLVYLGVLAALPVVDRVTLAVGALLVAAVWQWTPWKRRAITRCGTPVPLPPFGLRADLACLRFGLVQGSRCLRSTWALMLVMAVVDHGDLAVMLGLTAVMVLEDRLAWSERVRRPVGVALAAIALTTLAIA